MKIRKAWLIEARKTHFSWFLLINKSSKNSWHKCQYFFLIIYFGNICLAKNLFCHRFSQYWVSYPQWVNDFFAAPGGVCIQWRNILNFFRIFKNILEFYHSWNFWNTRKIENLLKTSLGQFWRFSVRWSYRECPMTKSVMCICNIQCTLKYFDTNNRWDEFEPNVRGSPEGARWQHGTSCE